MVLSHTAGEVGMADHEDSSTAADTTTFHRVGQSI